ncbi:DUF2169 family type VI secretion system accessory protein [Sorangium sp. So ce381]|uniref:DUF2169 family type VI secretion system accessory protein n=1 Tax=Sorangium sp. So ce381 TaxID=3133307 RepID=UPI003F5C6F9E
MAWRFKGKLWVTAMVKATFGFASDTTMQRIAPQEIIREEVHHRGLPSRSIRFATDLVPRLLKADVLFTGHAHAPHGRPVEAAHVRLGLFSSSWTLLDKTLMVRKRGGFVRLPIDYEHAFGGIGFPDNPFGEGHPQGSGEPNILDPVDARRVAGFGPISKISPARRRLLGATPRALLERGIPEIPDELSWDYFQAAPPDQRTHFLRGDEWIVMDGLHPSAPRMRMRLPGARGFARIHGLAGLGLAEHQELQMSADVLRIDGDEQRCTVTWRSSLPVPSEDVLPRMRIFAGVELPGEPIAWPAPGAAVGRAGATAPRAGAAGDEDDASLESTVALSAAASMSPSGTLDIAPNRALAVPGTLPFRPAPAGASPSPPKRPAPSPPEAPLARSGTMQMPKDVGNQGASPSPPEAPLARSGTMQMPKDVDSHAARQPATPFTAEPPRALPAEPPRAPPDEPPRALPAEPPRAPPAEPSAPAASAAAPAVPTPDPASPAAAGGAFAWATPPPEPPPPEPPPAGAPKRPAKLDVRALLYGAGKGRG